MSDMDFFEQDDDLPAKMVRFDKPAPGERVQSVRFAGQPATIPVLVKAATVTLVVFGGIRGAIGDFRFSLIHEGRNFPLDYSGFPRAMTVDTRDILSSPQIICESIEGLGYGQSYTMPLADSGRFLICQGKHTELQIDRELDTEVRDWPGVTIIVLVEMHERQAPMSRREYLRRCDLTPIERAFIYG